MTPAICRQIAADYRSQSGRISGVVVIYNEAVTDFIDTIRNPEQFKPGCIGVLRNDALYETVGGNDYEGATRWQRVYNAEEQAA